MRPVSRHLRVVLAASPLLFLACGGSGDGGNPIVPITTGIRAIAGANAADTVGTLLRQALIVEVRQADGRVAQGVVVRFEARPPADTARRFEPAIYVCSLVAPSCYGQQFVSDTTDAQGRAKVLIRLGQVAGKSTVSLQVPELGLEDSASFTVLAGSPARVVAAVRDTGLDIGGTAVLRGRVTDRYNNARPEQPQLALGAGSVVSLDAATATVTGRQMGTQWLYTRYESFVDSTSVRVIPAGRLVVWAAGPRDIRLVNLNGNGRTTTLVSNVSSDFGTFPHFDGTRQKVSLHTGSSAYGGPPNTIVVVDTASGASRFLGPSDGFNYIIAQRGMSDGSLLVVGRHGTDAQFGLWKVLADNSASLVVALPAQVSVYDGADISRDGTKLAYMATNAGMTELRTVDVATGVTATVTSAGRSPRWSPNGERLAYLTPVGYLDGNLRIRNADGSETTWTRDYLYSPGLTWSPDGTYIVGRSSDSAYPGLRLVRVDDGAFVMVRHRGSAGGYEDYYQPDWR